MLRLGSIDLGGMPKIAVGFTDKNPQLAQEASRSGVDVAELRIDQFSSFDPVHVLGSIADFADLPTLATIRLESEGGGWNRSEAERLDLFRAIVDRVDAVDVELAATGIRGDVATAAKNAGKLLVVSHHDFERTPTEGELSHIAEESYAVGADIVKLATLANSDDDVRCLTRFTMENAHRNVIVIGMGAHGLKTRLFLPALGSLMTFAFLGQPTAPGQIHFSQMFDLIRLMYPAYNQEKINSLALMECI